MVMAVLSFLVLQLAVQSCSAFVNLPGNICVHPEISIGSSRFCIVRDRTSSQIHSGCASAAEPNDNFEASTRDVIDDPCWGGPEFERHNLRYLLHKIGDDDEGVEEEEERPFSSSVHSSKSLILHESDSYLVLNKPPDLRMYGPHPSTVHKLLTYWYPSPGLVARAEELSMGRRGEGGAYRSALLALVSELSAFNGLDDNQIRTCHQLDYATSGVLLSARTKKAAAAACHAFATRQTQKEYVAVVHGHINMMTVGESKSEDGMALSSLPVLSAEDLQRWEDGSEEERYLRSRKDELRDTFDGYMRPSDMFVKWKGMVIQRRKLEAVDGENEVGNKVTNRASLEVLENSEDLQVEKQFSGGKGAAFVAENVGDDVLNCSPPLSAVEESRLLTLNWSTVKKVPRWKVQFKEMSDRYNAARREELSTEELQGNDAVNNVPLPPLFQIEGEDESAFYVHASLARIEGEFHMQIDPYALERQDPHIRSHYTSFAEGRERKRRSDASKFDYKPALTRCVILWKGTLNGRSVTKLLMQPRTGRRHQLRLHAVVAGHPIVGDVTYEHPSLRSGDEEVDTGVKRRRLRRREHGLCNRMCLHAISLSLPLLDRTVQTFTAPDPFRVEHDKGGNERLVIKDF